MNNPKYTSLMKQVLIERLDKNSLFQKKRNALERKVFADIYISILAENFEREVKLMSRETPGKSIFEQDGYLGIVERCLVRQYEVYKIHRQTISPGVDYTFRELAKKAEEQIKRFNSEFAGFEKESS
jgi:hypothetical protein